MTECWRETTKELPPMHVTVIIYRAGAINPPIVQIGLRQQKYGTFDDWEWLVTGSNACMYWGVSSDEVSGLVTHWMPLPNPPRGE